MKRLNEILTRFLRAANVRWTCYGIVSSFTPYPTTVIKYLTFSNFTEFNQSEESCGKSQGRQVRRMATEIRKMGKTSSSEHCPRNGSACRLRGASET